jgi:hypothetical protein
LVADTFEGILEKNKRKAKRDKAAIFDKNFEMSENSAKSQ